MHKYVCMIYVDMRSLINEKILKLKKKFIQNELNSLF